jgi:hypothetical protein
LILGEDPEQFRQLREDTHADLRPVGTIEHALADRVVFTIWRQRRLARAEWAQAQRRLLPKHVSYEARTLGHPEIDKTDGSPRDYTDGQKEAARQILADLDRARDAGWLPGYDGWTDSVNEYPALFQHILDHSDPYHEGRQDIESYLDAWVEVHFDGQWADYLSQIRLEAGAIAGEPVAVARLDHVVDLILAGAVSEEVESQRYIDYQSKLDRQFDRLLTAFYTQQQRRFEDERTIVGRPE